MWERERPSGSSSKINSVFYAESYHPIQAGSIDGTDILPHDNGVYRAHLCASAGLYDPFGDPKAMGKHGRVKNLRLVRHIVTGASRGYAFVEYQTEREMRRAYEVMFGLTTLLYVVMYTIPFPLPHPLLHIHAHADKYCHQIGDSVLLGNANRVPSVFGKA
ncbi:hypothetical protein RJ639_035418 [Escallonia herrerae]|uniref:RRM domain-containing protein n=1 Tax=Escallonia herrerae TaxID=1293975 RepID=A0AA88WSK7_9ASTE|nr:hypothetical protein RJ639_035418 [Escallonia herrerae]